MCAVDNDQVSTTKLFLFYFYCKCNVDRTKKRGRSCSEEEKSSQQEDGVGDEVGGVALLHQTGAVTPGDEQ